jgi:hypothetical protein
MAPTTKQNCPRVQVLNKKEIGVKFNENSIINSKATNGQEATGDRWNMQNTFKMQ